MNSSDKTLGDKHHVDYYSPEDGGGKKGTGRMGNEMDIGLTGTTTDRRSRKETSKMGWKKDFGLGGVKMEISP